MKIDSSDKMTGRIVVKAGVSLWSWGENIPIQLYSINETNTRVKITSSPKTGIMFGGAFDMGKNRKNIESILFATSKILESYEPEVTAFNTLKAKSVADEILGLKELLDQGALTHEEFERLKLKLLE